MCVVKIPKTTRVIWYEYNGWSGSQQRSARYDLQSNAGTYFTSLNVRMGFVWTR